MNPNDIVRVLDDPLYGWAPIGSVDQIVGPWVRVKLDDPGFFGREHSWFTYLELEVVDIAKWEAAINDDTR